MGRKNCDVLASHMSVSVASTAQREAAAIDGNSHRVLLVDDDEPFRDAPAQQLADLRRFVVEAESGTAALALLERGEPVDIIVSDLSMPSIDGLSLIRAAQDRRPYLPAILLTGYAGESAALATGLRIRGTFNLLCKPVNGAELAEAIETLLAENGHPR